ncbi:hypothetical protein R3P38DRAFT_3362960 [Favolaschia claudopus]|uniref:Uncharacterized protein n=1 Tax=Favolaschia claudopus TaxID=2862362 RepID=A0AAW0AK62_9AGAR
MMEAEVPALITTIKRQSKRAGREPKKGARARPFSLNITSRARPPSDTQAFSRAPTATVTRCCTLPSRASPMGLPAPTQTAITGADGGPGVSCSVEWNGVYGRTYNLEVVYEPSSKNWVGTVIDTVTGQRVHMGSYKLPSRGEPADHCAKLPYQKTFFGVPTTTHELSKGTENLAFEIGDCKGQVDFSTTKVEGGVQVTSGFKGQTGE